MAQKTAPEAIGRWSELFEISNVAVHAHLLPNGKILHWGRRKDPTLDNQSDIREIAGLDEHTTKAFLWTPYPEHPVGGKFGTSKPVETSPRYKNTIIVIPEKEDANLFCSGHTLLPSGNLISCGGHWDDGFGIEQATIFDYNNNTWMEQPVMRKGRWYPSVLSLPDGRVFVISGSDNQKLDPRINSIPQILTLTSTKNGNSTSEIGVWTDGADPVPAGLMLDLFPRMHIDPTNGNPVMVGTKPETWTFELKDADGNDIKVKKGRKELLGRWRKEDTQREAGFCDYASSVMYESGKIVYIGGGTDKDVEGHASAVTEFLDLNVKPLKWDSTKKLSLNRPRKQLNATVLADGTVLVTGGHSGASFNEWEKAELESELFDPAHPEYGWQLMAKESTSRIYHSVALLLPDGRVWSAGGGEYGGCPHKECHINAQIYEPPYLFRGDRPTITSAPSELKFGEPFTVTVGEGQKIAHISLIRLGSVTHCRNMSQQLIWLEKTQQGSQLTVQAPANPNIAPPGPYMLFVLTEDKVPSLAHMVSVPLLSAPVSIASRAADVAQQVVEGVQAQFSSAEPEEEDSEQVHLDIEDHDENMKQEQDQPHVTVGLTPLCPYGLGPCWGGAYDGLQAIKDIDKVRPIPSHVNNLAFVYLKNDIIPDIDVWREEFSSVANKGYKMRGIELTVLGSVKKSGTDGLVLAGTSTRSELRLAPYEAKSQLKWDIKQGAQKPITEKEGGAYKALQAAVGDQSEVNGLVTGTLQKDEAGKYYLDVRKFELH